LAFDRARAAESNKKSGKYRVMPKNCLLRTGETRLGIGRLERWVAVW